MRWRYAAILFACTTALPIGQRLPVFAAGDVAKPAEPDRRVAVDAEQEFRLSREHLREALSHLGEAARAGHQEAREELRVIAAQFGSTPESFRALAELGDDKSMVTLGRNLMTDDRTADERAEGHRWLLRAAEAGNPEAQYYVAVDLLNGHGAAVDRVEGLLWLKRAAKGGLSHATSEFEMMRKELAERAKSSVRKVDAALTEGGAHLTDCVHCPVMVALPPGEFDMGSDDPEYPLNEQPQHHVAIRHHVALAETPVTFEQWGVCVEFGGCQPKPDMSWGQGQQPVINVTWDDAQAYVAWLNSATDGGYRLPSEAEWEYAARAGTHTADWWGDVMKPGYANCQGCNAGEVGHPTPVKSFKPNPFGLYDMAGNVWQWTSDCLGFSPEKKHPTYIGAPADGRPWFEASNTLCAMRMLRGGAWDYSAWYSRHGARNWLFVISPEYYDTNIGFRVALELEGR